MTNLDIATLAQAIQDNSGDNVNVHLTYNLGGSGHQWNVSAYLWRDGDIVAATCVNPVSDFPIHRLQMLAKYGYQPAKAAY